ncbi:Zeatin O-glucosyltransferase [Sesamum angolense]|uniref:Zeatin O-glucosyltransferase n=1 Tax=Sesamum angolense TaxID=2727404 RepID=A0AAE2C0T6_9LAMI|nr:Zeatin O-glucosyltransferase [Sesamum angolense]
MANHLAMENLSQNNHQSSVENVPVAVVMVPLPLQGHLNQLLHLSRLVSAYSIPQPSPRPNAAIKFPTQILPLLRALTLFRQPVYDLVQRISATVGRVVVVYDSMMPYVVQDICSIPNAESYCFQSISAFSLYSFYWEATGKPVLPTEAELVEEVPSMEGCFPPEFAEISKLPKTLENSTQETFTTHLVLSKASSRSSYGVLRDADKGDVFEGEVRRAPLPENYEERVEGRGLIVREWAPQLEILGHPSTGGFISHCGWNSCIESISMGVPIAAWPMHSDQPRNAVLITKVLRIGVEIKDWSRRDEVVSSRTVEKSVRRLMASGEGDEIRKRAEELGDG